MCNETEDSDDSDNPKIIVKKQMTTEQIKKWFQNQSGSFYDTAFNDEMCAILPETISLLFHRIEELENTVASLDHVDGMSQEHAEIMKEIEN